MLKYDEADDGDTAFELYKKCMEKTCCNVRYKLILTDINMPRMDGITETEEIMNYHRALQLKDPTIEDIVIIGLTALNECEELETNTQQAGMKTVLYKPLDMMQLRLLIENQLDIYKGIKSS